jgi:4-(cytidine 5'-diphospho)-2-C-methyl-D-erythritol kinase
LGADCTFFITAEPAYAEGIGEILLPINIAENNLKGYYIVVVKPSLAISTKEAFAHIRPHKPSISCREIVAQPIETWRNRLTNDFEDSIFPNHPELANIKKTLYNMGATYAQMSGSGSSLFGIFKEKVDKLVFDKQFPDCKVFILDI